MLSFRSLRLYLTVDKARLLANSLTDNQLKRQLIRFAKSITEHIKQFIIALLVRIT